MRVQLKVSRDVRCSVRDTARRSDRYDSEPRSGARDENGEVYIVRYEAVNAMLLNEFLKEHRTVQEQQREIDALKAELKEQRALIQKWTIKWNSTDLHRKPF